MYVCWLSNHLRAAAIGRFRIWLTTIVGTDTLSGCSTITK